MKKKFSFNKKQIISGMLLVLTILGMNYMTIAMNFKHNISQDESRNNTLKLSSTQKLFEGVESVLNITDSGVLFEKNQEISLSSQESFNLTYFLDDVHDWRSSEINFTIQDIQDTREWVSDADYFDIEAPFRTYLSPVVSNYDPPGFPTHNYSADLSSTDFPKTINESGAKAMRLHFSRIEFETDWDYLFIYDGDGSLQYLFTGTETNFYTPWINADNLTLSVDSDGTIQWYGYDVDYYEFYNSSSTTYSQYESSWGYDTYGLSNNFGPGNISNSSAMYISLMGDPSRDIGLDATYYGKDYVELYQNITIPRGEVIDGYISFDYYAESAIASNEFFIYCAIDNQIVYNKGFRDITEYEGRGIWHDTGKIYMALWNNKDIFQNIQMNQNYNISIGIMSGASITYSGFEDLFEQRFWFDNVSLVLTTLANSLQDGINLTIDGNYLIDDSSWGKSSLSLNNLWTLNPITIEVKTTSPSLSFNLNASIFGYREATSKIDQQNNEGLNYYILGNGTVMWQFFHNLYMPNDYSEFEFLIDKPKNWEILSVLDPTFLPVSYEGGQVGDNYLFLNKSSASYPGWWKFLATSPNFIQEENIEISRNDQWGFFNFRTGNTGQIKAQINYSSEIPNDLDQTIANLKIYDPEGDIWFEDSSVPLTNGTVIFSPFNIATHNSTGGIHNFTIFWGNGTSIGGYKSNFVITHDSYITLLRPEDAKLDNSTEGSVGDIIPLRLYIRDSENGDPITNAILSFNWTSGPIYMVEIGLGIYDSILDTSDLGSLGLYTIIVSSYKIGYENCTFNLKINLGENTVLQRLGSDSSIIINANSTITFFYYSEVDDDGITGATIGINITNPIYYSITETSPGTYSIKINTAFLDKIGTYQLLFEFSAPGYKPQTHIYQFQIVNPPLPAGSNPFLVLIIIISIAVISVLGSLSIRSYVLLPRKRRKEADLLSRTQRFKDMKNVQAIVISHRLSGIPLYTKSYSLLEKQKKELFSGFIQAITAIGEEIAGKRIIDDDNVKKTAGGIERLIELDFKYFYCLICDREEIRIVLVLQDRASEQLKEVITNLATSIVLTHSHILENWDGSIQIFEKEMPSIIDQYFNFFYKEGFVLNNPKYIATMRKEAEFSKMETRILNTIYSIAKNKSEFFLEDVVQTVHEDNKDLIIDSIEGLLDKKIIISNIN